MFQFMYTMSLLLLVMIASLMAADTEPAIMVPIAIVAGINICGYVNRDE